MNPCVQAVQVQKQQVSEWQKGIPSTAKLDAEMTTRLKKMAEVEAEISKLQKEKTPNPEGRGVLVDYLAVVVGPLD